MPRGDPRRHEALGWKSRTGPNPRPAAAACSRAAGISYTRYNNAITYVAAVAEGKSIATPVVKVTRPCIGHDRGQMINPDGVANQCRAARCRPSAAC